MADLTTRTPAGLVKDYANAHLTAVLGASWANGWTQYLGKLPDSPDQAIAFIDQGGPAGFPHLQVDWPGLQVLVRSSRGGTGYQDSYLMVRRIRDAILGCPAHPPQFPELDGITERGHIVPLGYDESDRQVWSSNYQLLVEPGVSALSHRTSL